MKYCNLLALFLAISLTNCDSERSKVLERISAEEYKILMKADYKEFDQTQGAGWRQYHDDSDLQILLLTDYIKKNNAKEHSLTWHLGQIYGMNDDYETAIENFEKCLHESAKLDIYKVAWNYYVHGSIAFMQRDEQKLDLYIDSLENHSETMNLDVLIRLKEKFSRPYREAY
jgi:tetratricopeptide (TPR) repeat protein